MEYPRFGKRFASAVNGGPGVLAVEMLRDLGRLRANLASPQELLHGALDRAKLLGFDKLRRRTLGCNNACCRRCAPLRYAKRDDVEAKSDALAFGAQVANLSDLGTMSGRRIRDFDLGVDGRASLTRATRHGPA